jgi:glycosyltransferase involved in cell wall biosynthesis
MNDDRAMDTILSIVIPTKNRFKYVKSAIINVLKINDQRIELVIQDNSESDELRLWINDNINDNRLKYNYSFYPLSFVGNFEQAITLSTGEYVCLIGDDDGVNMEIITIVEWMSSVNIDSLSTKISANYVWENSGVPVTKFTQITGGVLTLTDFNYNFIETNLEKQLGLFFSNGCIDYLKFGLPKLYQGIVKKDCLEKVKEITGNYFGGLSPDIFAAVSISLVAKKVYATNYPVIISGVCGESASIIEGLLKKNSKKVEDAPHLRNRGKYEWCSLIPYVYTVETIWADSAIAAVNAMKAHHFLKKFNIAKLSAYCIHYNKGIRYQVLNNLIISLKILNKSVILCFIEFLFTLSLLKSKKVMSFFYRFFNRVLIIFKFKKNIRFEGVNNIELASECLSKHLNSQNINFFKTNFKDIS